MRRGGSSKVSAAKLEELGICAVKPMCPNGTADSRDALKRASPPRALTAADFTGPAAAERA